MNFEPELEGFVRRFLENQGAVLEKRYQALDVLLPDSLAGLLETPEHISIHQESGPGSEAAGAYTTNYGSSLLEKMVNIACATVPVISCRLEFAYLKSQGFDKLINEQFTFFGSVGRVQNQAEVLTEYLFITCRYLAQSDEQKMGLLKLIFNLETGAYVPEMADMLVHTGKDFNSKHAPPTWPAERSKAITKWIERQAQATMAEEIGPFLASMTRRFRRDAANLEEYYASLKKEMEQGLERSGLSEQLRKERQEKIALLPAELVAKRDDLFKKYSVKVKIEPCSAMIIRTPAIKLLYRAAVGKKNKDLSLIFNPVTKSIDPVLCQGCGASTTRIYFCRQLHTLCPACENKCPLC